jgi:hypothetical protein
VIAVFHGVADEGHAIQSVRDTGNVTVNFLRQDRTGWRFEVVIVKRPNTVEHNLCRNAVVVVVVVDLRYAGGSRPVATRR